MDKPNSRLEALIALLVLLLALGLLIDKLAAAWPFTTDDAYISLRYSRNLANGEGIAWNVGEPRVEGYSNFLYVLLGAVALRTGVEPIFVLKTLGVLALLSTSLIVFLWGRKRTGPLLACLPLLLLTSYYGSIWWSVSGLETAIYQLLVLVAALFFALALGPASEVRGAPFELSNGKLAVAGILALLAGLTRPEGPLVVISMVAALLVHLGLGLAPRGSRPEDGHNRRLKAGALRAAMVLIVTFGVPYALYFSWRWGYFGRLLPNSVYCKSAWQGDSFLLLKSFWADWKIPVVLALVAPWSAYGAQRIFIWLLTLAYLLMLIGVDPIISYENRHLLAIFPLVLLAALWSVHWALCTFVRKEWQRTTTLLLVGVVLATVALNHADRIDHLSANADRYARRIATRTRLGLYLDQQMGPQQWILIGDTGVVPYLTEARVLDAFCLNNLEFTTNHLGASPRELADTFLAAAPDMIVVHSERPDRLQPRPEYGLYPALVDRPEFSARYSPRAVFATPFDDFHYFVFAREGIPGGGSLVP